MTCEVCYLKPIGLYTGRWTKGQFLRIPAFPPLFFLDHCYCFWGSCDVKSIRWRSGTGAEQNRTGRRRVPSCVRKQTMRWPMRWAQKYFVRCGRFSGGHFELYIVTTKKDKHARTVNLHYLIIMRILHILLLYLSGDDYSTISRNLGMNLATLDIIWWMFGNLYSHLRVFRFRTHLLFPRFCVANDFAIVVLHGPRNCVVISHGGLRTGPWIHPQHPHPGLSASTSWSITSEPLTRCDHQRAPQRKWGLMNPYYAY